MNKSRPKKVLIRLNDDELTQLKSEIERSGMTQQDYILSKLFPKDEQVLAPKTEVIAPNKICPNCGADLVVRDGIHRKFWGCSEFPKCDYTEDYDYED